MNFSNPELLSAEKGCTGAHHGDGPADLSFLDGKQIIRTGYIPEMREGGFTIDYDDDGVTKRVVFGYNDFGLWAAWKGEPDQPNEADVLKARIEPLLEILNDQNCYSLECYPLERNYAFVDVNGIPVLPLTLKELKLMGSGVVECFSELPLDSEEIFGQIYAWVVE